MNYVQKREAIQRELLNTGERIGRQLTVDCLCLVLHEQFGWGYERLRRLTEAMGEEYRRQSRACQGGPEADYYQEQLDRALLEIIGDGPFTPFRERYPEIRQHGYGGKKK